MKNYTDIYFEAYRQARINKKRNEEMITKHGQYKLNHLRDIMKRYGVDILTWSPGDGVTRYRFVEGLEGYGYFGVSGDKVLTTAMGLKEANIVARTIVATLTSNLV